MTDVLLGAAFACATVVSLGASWMLVRSLERVGARLGLSEALLGMLAALAADAPEITAATTALVRHDRRVGAGVVIGSNLFNLAALLGLAALVAGRIALHRRVIELAGAVAIWMCAVSVAVVVAGVPPALGLLASLALFVPYLLILGARRERLAGIRAPARWTSWLSAAVSEEEQELEPAIHPPRGRARDGVLAAGAVAVVVGASIAMEHTGVRLGGHLAVPAILVGALVLAAVTSLPNAVAAVYLARRGRGTATLSTALNSNGLNVIAGLLLPTTVLGVGAPSGQTTFLTAAYAALTVLALALAHLGRGLDRRAGAAIVIAYLAFTGILVSIA